MNPEDRQRLNDLRFPADVIARTEEVLRAWGVERLFTTCCHCGKACLDPDLPRGKRLRKRLPADLFHRREMVGCRDTRGRVACLPCDDFEFEHGFGLG